MILQEVKSGSLVRITGFSGNRNLERKLRQLGLMPGDLARILRIAPFNGPFLLEVSGREIAVSNDITSKIKVEVQA
jgi:Fe2+ transport system protein FeoA